jgi:hypothetical protein
MRFWTIRRRYHKLAAALALLIVPTTAHAAPSSDPAGLYQTMKAAYARGATDGWHRADQVYFFSTVLDAGRAYQLFAPNDPNNATLAGLTVDLATELHYDVLTNRDAAEWYVRAAAEANAADDVRGSEARALLAKLDGEDADPAKLAADADEDATLNVVVAPDDPDALLEQVEAERRAYLITKNDRYRSLAQDDAAQPGFPSGRDVARDEAYPAVAAPADEYFGQTKLSPLGVRNALERIGKYLDAGWGNQMTKETLWVVDSLEDWQHQYPRDYELPRLLLQTYNTLGRMDSPEAQKAEADVRRILTVEYNATAEARSLLTSE